MIRYSYINEQINIYKPKILMEIGTFHGDRAESMILTALKHNKDVEYYGFDLFDDFTEFQKEFCYKGVSKLDNVKNKLSKYNNVNLIKGYTKDTLINFNVNPDFVFIDGGHSLETIQNDWNHVRRLMKKNTVVIFDDHYYNRSDVGAQNIIKEISNNKEFKVTHSNLIDTCENEKIGKIVIGVVKVEFSS